MDCASLGHIVAEPKGVFPAGSRQTFTFVYTVGTLGMKAGGSLRIATPNDDWEFPLAPMHRYFQRGHERGGYDNGICSYARRNLEVALQTAGKAWIDLDSQECGVAGTLTKGGAGWSRHIIAIVRDADLAPGDRITVVYGDRSWGEDGARVQRVAPLGKDRFHAFVDLQGTRDFEELPADGLLGIDVQPGPTAQLNLVAPAIVRPGSAFTLRVAGMDAYRNRPTGVFEGPVRLGASTPGVCLPGEVRFSSADANLQRVPAVRVLREGVVRLTAEPADGSGSRSVGNPIWCTRRELNLYFGDLHCQSKYHSDSVGTPAEGYAYGRDVAGLDFMGITDSAGCYKDGWIETQEATRAFHDPGRFVTFKAHEYGATKGHRNVIYRNDAPEGILQDLPRNDLHGLFAYYRGRDVIIIPHHTKVWTDWDFHDPELEPIAEAYSCWGSGVEASDPLWRKSTKPGAGLFAALQRGYRFGFIGSGDSHAGMPGRSFPADRQWCVDAKSGFACVYAPELTREAIFDALKARRCYATTGARIILEFSLNGVGMGAEARLEHAHAPRHIHVHVIGTDVLDHLRIVRNGRTLVRRELGTDEAFFDHVDTEPANGVEHTFVVVVQRDGNTAWSSPIWTAVAAPES